MKAHRRWWSIWSWLAASRQLGRLIGGGGEVKVACRGSRSWVNRERGRWGQKFVDLKMEKLIGTDHEFGGLYYLGNAASLFLYTVPILTFKRVIKKGSTEEFSCIPYIIALLNCLLYTWFGLPVVSKGWENFTVATINGLGILLETSFIIIYIWFASPKCKKLVIVTVALVMIIFGATAFISSFVILDHPHRKVFVGSVALVASASMYGSPLVAMRQVIKTRSVEFMPFYLSFFSFLASFLWMLYGLLGHELFIAAPNFVGTPMAILQLVLYCMYKNKKEAYKESSKMDLEKNEEKLTS